MSIDFAKSFELEPVNGNVFLKYSLTDSQLNSISPITKDGVLQMTQGQLDALSETYGQDYFDPKWSFEEAQGTNSFRSILMQRLANSALLQHANVLKVSKQIKDKWGFLAGREIVLSENLIGSIQKFDEGCQAFYTTFTIPNKRNFNFPFMAYSNETKTKYIPVEGFIEISFSIPPEFSFTQKGNLSIKGDFIPKKYNDPSEISLEEFKNIAKKNGDLYMNATVGEVSSISEKEKQFKVGDNLFIKPSVNFRLDKLHRIDLEANKLYYFTDVENILSKVVQ